MQMFRALAIAHFDTIECLSSISAIPTSTDAFAAKISVCAALLRWAVDEEREYGFRGLSRRIPVFVTK
jgi:hypothetical protein